MRADTSALRTGGSSPSDSTTLDDRLADGIGLLELDIDGATRARLLEFLRLLAKWNAVYNLTSVRSVSDMLAVHLLDALSIVPFVDRLGGATVIDVGSGAGLPAIPLAIVRPGLTITSIDAVGKKIAFQRQVKLALRLDGLTPLHGRVEDVRIEPPDLIVARAYAELPAMLDSVRHLASERTAVIAMKGVVPTMEIAAVSEGWSVLETSLIDVPFLGAERCAVVFKRAGPATSGN